MRRKALFCALTFSLVRNMYNYRVENSAHIHRPLTSPEIHAFATGYGADPIAGPVQVAWLLENTALERGWPVGASLGSEAELIERFASSRDMLRRAIRLVEARGLMRMRRGCKGGLRLLRPDVDQVAGTFAAFLQASGYCRASLDVAMSTLAPLLGELSNESVVRRLWERVEIHMSQNSPADKVEGARAEIVAIQLVQNVGSPVPETGVPLGCEAELCAEHVIAHRTLRETLGILDDLGMLQTKRGRGGGYWLKRPAPIGIIRRLFALLASRGTQSSYAEGVIWILGIANLQLAFRRMEALNSNLRAEWCDRLAAVLCGSTGLRRWVLFQKELTRVADDLFLSTMKSSMLAYLGRIGPVSPYYDKFDKHLLEVEKAMLQALRDGHSSEAERQLRIGHAYISRGPVFECLA